MIISTLLQVYFYVLLARLILSWFPNPPEALRPLYGFLFTITDPPLRLVRPLIPPVRMGGMALDLSPILILVLLQVLIAVFRGAGL